MDITIKASDGKLFNGTNYEELVKKVTAYELELKQKKEKEEAERKVKEETTRKSLKEVAYAVDFVNSAVEKYEKDTGEKLEFVTVNGKLETRKFGYLGKYTGIPVFIGTHDNWWNEFYKALREF